MAQEIGTLGAIPSPWDERDLDYAAKVFSTGVPLPPTFSLRDQQTLVKNQYEVPACVAFASCAANEALSYPDLFDLSEAQLYSKRVNAPNDGMTIRDAGKILKRDGVCTEECWAFRDDRPRDCAYDLEQSRKFAITTYRRVLGSIREAIWFEQKPLIAVVPVYENWALPNGVNDIPAPGGQMLGYHAILITGWLRDGYFFEFKNSWGTEWADNGYGYLPPNYPITEAWVFEVTSTPVPVISPIIESTSAIKVGIFGLTLNLVVNSEIKSMMHVEPGFNFNSRIRPGKNEVQVSVPLKIGTSAIEISFTPGVKYKTQLDIKAEIQNWEQVL